MIDDLTGWQPIKTAPRDGSYIIAGRFGASLELKWVKHSRWLTPADIAGIYSEEDDGQFEAAWADGNDEDEPCYPTHWLPLEPPRALTPTKIEKAE